MSKPQKRAPPADTNARPLKRAETEEHGPTGIESYMGRVKEAIGEFDLAEYVGKFHFKAADETKKLVEEYCRFMAIKVYLIEMCPTIKISPSDLVDSVWHLHILYTAEYRRFCTSLGVEIDHSPLDALDQSQHVKQLAICKGRYAEHFNASPPSEFWDEIGIPKKFKLTVSTLDGMRYVFNVTPDTTVRDVKTMFESRTGESPDQQRLLYAGRQLSDDMTLSYYNIGDYHTIHLVRSLRGC